MSIKRVSIIAMLINRLNEIVTMPAARVVAEARHHHEPREWCFRQKMLELLRVSAINVPAWVIL